MTRHIIIALFIALALPYAAARAQTNGALTELYSHDGVFTATLVAAPSKAHVGPFELDALTYNGDYAGPVLHIHPGDIMRIRLVNHLAQTTNLHFHGIRTSPLGNSDNAHLQIKPGDSFDYEIRVSTDQPTGLFWYHAHVHGVSEQQIMGGLSGTIVVEPAVPLPITTRLFVLKDMIFDDDTGNPEIDDKLYGFVQSVNGALLTQESMRPGETQLWRFTNHSANRTIRLALKGHRLGIVSEDGAPITAERPVDELEVPPGTRIDVLVHSGDPGQYELTANGMMTGVGAARSPNRIIGIMEVAGGAVRSVAIPSSTLPEDLRAVRIDEKRTVSFSQTKTIKAAEQKFFLNGKIFDANRMDVRVPLGNVEEWTIRNDSDDMHVFHIHQIGFQVVEVDGVPMPFNGYVDTVRIPQRGEVKLRLPFTDRLILGRFMFHCHVLKHEDGGMMANIEIYDPAPPALSARLSRLYMRVVWWWNGVPWSLCGLPDV
jgi:FtsP/CotA-like multicopper oxidase with cupredoxin domain